MEVIIEPEVVQDLSGLNREQKKYVRERLEELEENPTGHEDSGLIRVRGRQVFKFVMKDGDRDELDFRAVYDIDGDSVRVHAVFHRDSGYDKEKLDRRL